MKILLTGGTGFIGSHLVSKLLSLGHDIYLLTRPDSNTKRIEAMKAKVTILTYSKESDLDSIFSQTFDGIIHLSTFYLKQDDKAAGSAMTVANVTFPSLLLQKAVDHKLGFFINTGTCFEYKLLSKPLDEESETKPYNFYAATKLSFERILNHLSTTSDIKTATLRLFYPYGENDNKKLISVLMNLFIKNQPIQISKGEQQLDYTYVGDIVNAYVKTIEYLTGSDKKTHNVFNIGTGKPVSIRTIVSILEKSSGYPSPVTYGDGYAENEIMYMNCNNSKAKLVLNWEPKYTIETGLKKVYTYYKSHPNEL